MGQRLPGPRALALLLPVLLGVLGVSGCRRTGLHRFDPAGLAGPQLGQPIPKPDFTLTTTAGQAFNFRQETKGFVTLLFFGYTHCPDICPVHLANIAAAMSRLGPEVNNQLKVVFVTTDPARDTPDVMRRWLDKFDPRFIGLVGSDSAINAALAQLRMGTPEKETGTDPVNYTIGHPALVLAFTRDDSAHVVYPFGIRQADWAHDLRLLAQGG